LAANRLESEGLHLASVDCDAEPELCEKNQIPIYPTILLFRGSEPLVYNGPRKADAIAAFMRRHREPILTTMTSMSDVANFIVKDNITVVGYFDEDDETSRSIFATLAENHRGSYLFGRISEGVFGQAENVEKPAIVLYKTFDDGKDIYREPFDLKKIESFLEDSALPLISELGQDSASFQVAVSICPLLGSLKPLLTAAHSFQHTTQSRISLPRRLKSLRVWLRS
jgi:protein disulfide-isomerase A1